MAGFLVIARKGGATGFKCAGVDSMEVGEPADISSLLVRLQGGGKYGLIAVEEKLLEAVEENVLKRIRKKGLPIIIPIDIPARWTEAEYAESPVVRLIRRAIGYQIKIKR